MAAKKKSLEELLVEFIAMWDEYWNTGAGEGPSQPEMEKHLAKIRKLVTK